MKRILLSLLCFTATSSLALAGNPDPDRPKLVVGLVVDQMRWDYLYKFYDRYGNDGFRRLMRDGFNCEQTFINYIPSYTAPGHTCVYTGSVPAIHGIAGNEWFDNHTGKYWYCTEDTAVLPVGGSRLAGRMSPRNLLTSTVTDELRLATNFGSRVFGIAMKDRGSILPAGHLGAAYWYDDSTGNFISSTYYSESLPGWLEQFNNRRLADSFLSKDWHPLYPAATYRQSLPDNNRYEGLFPGEVTPVFPHSINRKNGYGMLRRIPAGNTMTLDAARSCLRGEQLGKGKFTDFLCISLSSTDYIGHQYAPDAMEVEDTYLRLDRELASLLKFLDEHVGKGQYLFFVTADHGGAHNADYLKDIKMPSGNISEHHLKAELAGVVAKKYGDSLIIRGLENYQVFLNQARMEARGINGAEVNLTLKEYLSKKKEVAFVKDVKSMEGAPLPEPLRTMVVNGYNAHRSGSLQIVLQPGYYFGYAPTGTTHGTWNPFDTHIPLIWYGWKIPAGISQRKVHMEDIAPTIAALLHIQMPSGCIGKVITEVTR